MPHTIDLAGNDPIGSSLAAGGTTTTGQGAWAVSGSATDAVENIPRRLLRCQEPTTTREAFRASSCRTHAGSPSASSVDVSTVGRRDSTKEAASLST